MNEHLTPMIAREAGLDEPQVESGRYLNAIWRSRYLIAGIAVAVAVAVAVVSLLLTSTYEARATVLLSNESSDSEVQRRQLATLDEFIVSSRVLSDAASELDLSKEELEDKVDSSVDPEANLIDVIASSEDPEQAAEIANTVVASFIDLPETIAPEKQLFENAEPPKDAASPKPLRNGVLALFAALFVGVLVALARDQFRPRIISTRDLSRLTGLSVLASIPEARWSTARRRRLITAVEDEAYRTLAAEVQLALPPEDRHLILVTSATHGEGKTTVTARLGQALAESGQDVLVIDGDLRWPGIHVLFDLPREPGLAGVLESAQNGATLSKRSVSAAARRPSLWGDGELGRLYVIPAGRASREPAMLFSPDALRGLARTLEATALRYVLIDCPPALGLADIKQLATEADQILWVARLQHLTAEQATDAQQLLARLPANLLGHVAIGTQGKSSPYYLSRLPSSD